MSNTKIAWALYTLAVAVISVCDAAIAAAWSAAVVVARRA
jgi:hypothetical protein